MVLEVRGVGFFPVSVAVPSSLFPECDPTREALIWSDCQFPSYKYFHSGQLRGCAISIQDLVIVLKLSTSLSPQTFCYCSFLCQEIPPLDHHLALSTLLHSSLHYNVTSSEGPSLTTLSFLPTFSSALTMIWNYMFTCLLLFSSTRISCKIENQLVFFIIEFLVPRLKLTCSRYSEVIVELIKKI